MPDAVAALIHLSEPGHGSGVSCLGRLTEQPLREIEICFAVGPLAGNIAADELKFNVASFGQFFQIPFRFREIAALVELNSVLPDGARGTAVRELAQILL